MKVLKEKEGIDCGQLDEFIILIVEISWLIAIEKDEMTLVWSIEDFKNEAIKRKGTIDSIKGDKLFKYFKQGTNKRVEHAWKPALITWTKEKGYIVDVKGAFNKGHENKTPDAETDPKGSQCTPETEKHDLKTPELDSSTDTSTGQKMKNTDTKQATTGGKNADQINKMEKTPESKANGKRAETEAEKNLHVINDF